MGRKLAIQSEQVRLLFSASYVSLATSALLAATLAYVQFDVVSFKVVITWISLSVLIAFLRAALVVAYRRSTDSTIRMHVWLTRFRLGVLISGLVWGSAGFLMYPNNQPEHQMFLIFMLAGLTAGGVVSFLADLVSAIVFSASVMLPLIIRLIISADIVSTAMGVAAMLYFGFMIFSLRHINQNVRENMILRLDATDREETVRASKERYRLLLSHLPVGIFHYDINYVITFCNENFANFLHNSVDKIVGFNMKTAKDQSTLPALGKALMGEVGHYEGNYNATLGATERWISLICAPMLDGVGKVVGGIVIVQDINERKQTEDKVEKLAFYDPLTQLPNRRLLYDRINQALAVSAHSGSEGAIMFLDIDHFKTLNDSRGHDAGDLLLRQVANRLAACLREGDTVARLGGDEFVVVLQNLGEQEIEAAAHAEVIGEKILAAISQPFHFSQHEYQHTASLGVELFKGNNQPLEELLKHADIAMYQAKKAGRNTLRFFDQKMQDVINTRVTMERDLRKAIEKQQFQLYYQVQADNLGQTLGAEALIRWNHPERGLVSPAEFVPLAEDTGLIIPIGQWVIETACAQIKAWQQAALTSNLVLSVNVSAKQFRQANFVEQVQSAVQRHSIDPMQLKLELTESVLLENIEDTIATMEALNEIGVRFSLDDFGIGYSSLQYLRQLPLHQLKIDQSFVRDIVTNSSDRTIVNTIIAMAHSLNLDVIAEGVETVEQQQLLFSKGCTHYQGYLFGRPVPIEQFDVAKC